MEKKKLTNIVFGENSTPETMLHNKMILLDEAHYLLNNSQQNVPLRNIIRQSTGSCVVCLTATPSEGLEQIIRGTEHVAQATKHRNNYYLYFDATPAPIYPAVVNPENQNTPALGPTQRITVGLVHLRGYNLLQYYKMWHSKIHSPANMLHGSCLKKQQNGSEVAFALRRKEQCLLNISERGDNFIVEQLHKFIQTSQKNIESVGIGTVRHFGVQFATKVMCVAEHASVKWLKGGKRTLILCNANCGLQTLRMLLMYHMRDYNKQHTTRQARLLVLGGTNTDRDQCHRHEASRNPNKGVWFGVTEPDIQMPDGSFGLDLFKMERNKLDALTNSVGTQYGPMCCLADSKTYETGTDFTYTQVVWLLSPPDQWHKYKQAVGRPMRACAHAGEVEFITVCAQVGFGRSIDEERLELLMNGFKQEAVQLHRYRTKGLVSTLITRATNANHASLTEETDAMSTQDYTAFVAGLKPDTLFYKFRLDLPADIRAQTMPLLPVLRTLDDKNINWSYRLDGLNPKLRRIRMKYILNMLYAVYRRHGTRHRSFLLYFQKFVLATQHRFVYHVDDIKYSGNKGSDEDDQYNNNKYQHILLEFEHVNTEPNKSKLKEVYMNLMEQIEVNPYLLKLIEATTGIQYIFPLTPGQMYRNLLQNPQNETVYITGMFNGTVDLTRYDNGWGILKSDYDTQMDISGFVAHPAKGIGLRTLFLKQIVDPIAIIQKIKMSTSINIVEEICQIVWFLHFCLYVDAGAGPTTVPARPTSTAAAQAFHKWESIRPNFTFTLSDKKQPIWLHVRKLLNRIKTLLENNVAVFMQPHHQLSCQVYTEHINATMQMFFSKALKIHSVHQNTKSMQLIQNIQNAISKNEAKCSVITRGEIMLRNSPPHKILYNKKSEFVKSILTDLFNEINLFMKVWYILLQKEKKKSAKKYEIIQKFISFHHSQNSSRIRKPPSTFMQHAINILLAQKTS